ncbi:MAG: hypothetical protein L0Z63_01925 [Actinobacteria bacterium]|nr:hypothetical protein [Actinomycetota bacterium]
MRLLFVTLLLTGCLPQVSGPSPTDPPEIETTTTEPGVVVTTITAAEGASRFRECLDSRGITIEPIPLDAGGHPRLDLVLRSLDFTTAANAEALDVCAVHLISGALDLEDSALVGSGVLELLDQFGDCVRGRGVPDFPAMVGGFKGIGPPFPIEEIPYDDPDLADAVADCRAVLAGE